LIPALLLLLTLVVGLAAARRTRDSADFFVAGRRLGAFRAGIAVAASAFSGFVFLGGPGLTAQVGFGSLFIVVPAGFTAALLCRTAGRRLAVIAEASGAQTLPESIAFRFGNRAPAVLAAVAILIGSVIYLGVQLAALARVARFAFPDADIGPLLWLGLGILLAYSLAGGMVASVNTDVLQGVVMVIAAVAAFWWVMTEAGGPAGVAAGLAAQGPSAVELLKPLGVLGPATGFGFLLLFSIGTLGQPHMLHKFLMLKSPEALRFLPAVVGGAQGLSILVWIGLGAGAIALTGGALRSAAEHPDEIALAVFSLPGTPQALAGLVAAAVLAAIMSTSDAFLNLGAAALCRDLPGPRRRDRFARLASARAAALLVGVMALGIAQWHLAEGELIAWLGTLGFGAFAAALAPTMLLGLGWKRVTARASVLSMVAGLGALFGLETLAPGLPVPSAALAVGAAFAVLVVTSLLSREETLPERVQLAMTL
jgi:Na+/proline symporter